MELIDKSKLLEELKRCEKICDDYMLLHKDTVSQGIANAKRTVCQHFIKFLDTIETKEVDLEKEFENFVVDDPVIGNLVNFNAAMIIAKHFFELGLKAKGE